MLLLRSAIELLRFHADITTSAGMDACDVVNKP